MAYAGEALATQVRPNFLVKLEERVYIHEPSADIERHAFIEIRDRLDRELVTVIEVLSPTNKRYGPDREQYLLKRSAKTTFTSPRRNRLWRMPIWPGQFHISLRKKIRNRLYG